MSNSQKENLVSVIIPNYNGEGVLKDCLTSINLQTHRNIEIILVDNASADSSVKITKKLFPKVKIIQNEKNYGFGRALNRGLDEANGKYALFLNNDTIIPPEMIKILVKKMKSDSSLGIVFASETEKLAELPNPLSGVVFELNGFQFKSVTKDHCYLEPNGACFMMKTSKKIFSENYFLFGEEYYTGFIQNCKNKKVMLVKEAFFEHKKKHSIKKLKDFSVARNVEKSSLKNFFTTWDKKTMLLLLPILLIDLIYSHIYLILSLKLGYSAGKIAGTIDFILSVKQNIKQRNEIKKDKKVDDAKILKIFTESKLPKDFGELGLRGKIFAIYKIYLSFFIK